MKIKNILLFSALSSFALACGNNSSEDTSATDALNNSDTTAVNLVPPSVMPASDSISGMQVTSAPAGSVTTAPSGAGLNPAHGEPGHRCEIPVGAPLDSKPPAGGTPATGNPAMGNPTTGSPVRGMPDGSSPLTITPTPPGSPAPAPGATAAPAAQPAATPAGMNPPHGQPGHDCAIPVGAPLKK